MRICTECFRKFPESEIKIWKRDGIKFRESHPMMCPDCYAALHDGWDIPGEKDEDNSIQQ